MGEEKGEGHKRGIVWQTIFGLWFLFWSAAMVWCVYTVGFVPMFVVMLVLCVISLVVLWVPVKGKETK